MGYIISLLIFVAKSPTTQNNWTYSINIFISVRNYIYISLKKETFDTWKYKSWNVTSCCCWLSLTCITNFFAISSKWEIFIFLSFKTTKYKIKQQNTIHKTTKYNIKLLNIIYSNKIRYETTKYNI